MSATDPSTRSDPLLVACSLIPAAGLFALYSYVVRARLALGAWPQPYRPDPKDLGFALHHGAVAVLLEAALLSPLALILCLLVHRMSPQRRRRAGSAVVVFLVGYLALWAALRFDPGSFMEWYAD